MEDHIQDIPQVSDEENEILRILSTVLGGDQRCPFGYVP
jgi:hypothetical protein